MTVLIANYTYVQSIGIGIVNQSHIVLDIWHISDGGNRRFLYILRDEFFCSLVLFSAMSFPNGFHHCISPNPSTAPLMSVRKSEELGRFL